MRILYVEDALLNLRLIERIARIGNHDVINYPYAEEALDRFEEDDPDLVLVDIRLDGDMDGIELVRELRARGHAQPIVAITALASNDVAEQCLLAGCDDFFAKPLAVRELLRLLQRYENTPLDDARTV